MDIQSTPDDFISQLLKSAPTLDAPPKYETGDVALDVIEKTLDSDIGRKLLKDEIEKLGNAAQSVEIAFRNVSRGLAKAVTIATEGRRPQESKKLEKFKALWDTHHKKYVELVWESRRVAGNARAIATDFAGDFLDVIKDQQYSVEEKRQEIAAYREELEKDMKNAEKLSQGFTDLHTAVVEFSQDIQEYIKQRNDAMAVEMNKLLDEMEVVKKELERAKKAAIGLTLAGLGIGGVAAGVTALGVVCPLLWIVSAVMVAGGAGAAGYGWHQYHKLSKQSDSLQKRLAEHQNAVEVMNKITATVGTLQEDIDLIQEKLVIFAQIWSIIRADLNAIEGDLKLASSSVLKARFEKRIKAVSITYKTLALALRLYETNVHIQHSAE